MLTAPGVKRLLSSAVHTRSQAGFAKGTNELYNRARPKYPPETLSRLRGAVKSCSPLNVVEIGSGTGIFTRALLEHPEWSSSVRKLQAVDPSNGMREEFSKKTPDERVRTSEGTFDNTGVNAGWADIVVIAHAFHWCSDYDAAATEFARILKPDGLVALIWNHEDRDAAPWLAKVRDRVEVNDEGSPHWRTGLWRQIFDSPTYTKHFNAPLEEVFKHAVPASLSTVTSRALSSSRVSVLPEAEKCEVVRDIEEIIAKDESKVWMEKSDGIFEYPHRTDFVICTRK